MQNELLLKTIQGLIEEGRRVLATEFDAGDRNSVYLGGRPRGVDLQKFARFQAGCANLCRMLGEAANESWVKDFAEKFNDPLVAKRMIGTLEAIQDAIQNGLLLKVEDLIRAESFDSLLEQADYLLSEGYFLAAGVLGRAVFEEQLRNWCDLKACKPLKSKPTLNDYKDAIYKAKHINVSVMKHFEALGAVGNQAAHNDPALTAPDVERLLRDVRDVLVRFPLA